MQRQRSLLALILVMVIAAIAVIATIPIPLGLDLRGGSQLTIQVKPTPEIPRITERELEAVKSVVEGRVNGLGVSEPVIQTVGEDKILVQLPGVNDPEEAERVLGGTAQLEFRQQKPNTETQLFALRTSQQELKQQQQQLKTLTIPQRSPKIEKRCKIIAKRSLNYLRVPIHHSLVNTSRTPVANQPQVIIGKLPFALIKKVVNFLLRSPKISLVQVAALAFFWTMN